MYNIKSVAKMLDMPAVTIRAWERRYHVVTPVRSESGHRLYTEQDIEDLRWLKMQTEEKGINISQAVKMLEKRRGEHAAVPERMETSEEAFASLRDRLLEALLMFDAEKANAVLSLGFSMFHYEEVFHKVLAPLLHHVGDLWEQGEASVAQEHFASHFIQQRFYQFFAVFTTNPALPKVVALCPAGEHHQIGLLLFTLFLRRSGFDVIYLGPNTPIEGVAPIVERHHAKIVAVSLTSPELRPQALELVGTLREQFPKLQFVLGGQGFGGCLPDEQEPSLLAGCMEEWKKWAGQVAAL